MQNISLNGVQHSQSKGRRVQSATYRKIGNEDKLIKKVSKKEEQDSNPLSMLNKKLKVPNSGLMKGEQEDNENLFEHSKNNQSPEFSYNNKKPTSNYKHNRNDVNKRQSNKLNFYEDIRNEDLEFLVENAKSKNWATRVHSFEKIAEWFNESSTRTVSDQHQGDVLIKSQISAHMNHIDDTIVKVQEGCFRSINSIFTLFKEQFRPEISRLLINSLINSLLEWKNIGFKF